jgi:electron transfer flavoprotein alpha subunit
MENDGNSVWVLAEFQYGTIPEVSLQLVGKARELADTLDVSVEVVLLGFDIGDQADILFHLGADVVFLGDNLEFEGYQPELFTEVIVSLAEEKQPQIFLLGSTIMGRELAPLVAARLKTGLTAHCTNLKLDSDQLLEQWIPAYGGMINIICPHKRPQMATVSRGVFPTPPPNKSRTGQIVPLLPPKGFSTHVQILDIVKKELPDVSFEKANTVVAGGAGVGDPQGWQEVKQLAQILNAALGSTRPVVDKGWANLETMIGQSGKMVNPALYIGVGISGELQHMVGIVGSENMIAINNDPKAPIFEQVDYGIVEDCRDFLPVLLEKLQSYVNTK